MDIFSFFAFFIETIWHFLTKTLSENVAYAIDPFTAMLIAGAVSKGVGYFGAASDESDAKNKLAAMRNDPMATYNLDPSQQQLYSSAMRQYASPRGFSGAETNAFRRNIGEGFNTQMSRGTSMSGGSMARALQSFLSGQQNKAFGDYATQDAQLRRSNENLGFGRAMGISNTMQSIRDRNTQNDINYRLMTERGLGAAVQGAKDFQRGTLQSLGSDLIGGGTTLAYGKMMNPTTIGGARGATPDAVDLDKFRRGLTKFGDSYRKTFDRMYDLSAPPAPYNFMETPPTGMMRAQQNQIIPPFIPTRDLSRFDNIFNRGR